MNTLNPSNQLWAGVMLLLSATLTSAGITLWLGRNLYSWSLAGSGAYLGWERGLVMAGMVTALLGLALLARLLDTPSVPAVAIVGVLLVLVGTVLGLGWEAAEMSRAPAIRAQINCYVVLALLGQAALGLALLQSGALAGWIGWFGLLLNLGALLLLPIFSPGDLYYPAIHMLMPLLVGIALLVQR